MEWTKEEQLAGLKRLREPFPAEHISQLPKPTCKKEEYDRLQKSHCNICGGYHATSKTIHLSFVGHAALTDRLLEVDPFWNWEPLAYADTGLPLFDQSGGMWGKLTVCGLTRLGFGHAKNNTFAEIGSREKEVIGDFLRNSAMRFGCALDLWSKADLTKVVEEPEPTIDAAYWCNLIDAVTPKNLGTIKTWKSKNIKSIQKMPEGQEKKETLEYIEEMIKEYSPTTKNQKEVKSEGRGWIDDAVAYLKSDKVCTSIDKFNVCWDANIKPNLNALPAAQQKELLALKSEIETKLTGGE